MEKFNLISVETSKLSSEILEFGPEACMECDFDGYIPISYFSVTPDVENEEDYKELQSIVKRKLGHESFSELGSDLGYLITVTRCPKCGSEEIFQDF